MKSPSTITRRRVLQGAALGAAALALPRSASAARPSGVVTLEFWNPAVDPVGKKVIAKLADQFNGTVGKAKGILVQNRPIADDNNAAKYTTAMTSSGSPDVVMTYSYDYLAPWAANGFIRPVDSYFSTTGMAENDLLPVVKDSVQLAGHTWGLLQEFDFAQLFWNKRLHTGALPTTLDELDALAKRYTVFDKHGNLTQAGLIPWSNKTFDPYTTGVALFGGSFYNQSTGKWTITTPQNLKLFQWYAKYADILGGRSKADALENSVPSTYGDSWLYGKAVFGFEGEWIPAQITQLNLKLSYGIGHPPTAPGVPAGSIASLGGNLFLLPTKSQHPAEAAAFIEYMGSAKGSAEWCILNSNMPPVKSALFAPSFLKALPGMASFIDALKINHVTSSIASPQYSVFADALALAVQEVSLRKSTPAQALSSIDSKVSSAVQQFQQFHPNWPSQ